VAAAAAAVASTIEAIVTRTARGSRRISSSSNPSYRRRGRARA
jgi:hypothetical protein